MYSERGASWWPVLWGPGFALVGVLVEGVTPGPKHVVTWLALGAVLASVTALWVWGRRRLCSVRLTESTLRMGSEELPVERIASIADEIPVGSRVLGGGAALPKGTSEIPLRLVDGDTVIGWAKHPDAVTRELRKLLDESLE